MNMKLTERQISTLKNVDNGSGRLCNKRTLSSLEKKGLIKLHIPIGWTLTKDGIHELMKVE
ncbi:hypothetical protein PROVRETT_05964 [Providencia rettgeri DSM 1131]|nr:hypothetical protein PROVRETT_05964 [Providencia rettgeri DSM 1131]